MGNIKKDFKVFKIPLLIVLLYGILVMATGMLIRFLGVKTEIYATLLSLILNFIICGIIWLINKKYIGVSIGFKIEFTFFKRHKITAVIVAIVTLLTAVINIKNLPLAILISLQAGIVEEVVCRGIVSKYIYNHLLIINKSKRIWISAITSGTFFGLLHFINLTRQELLPTISQVIVASGLGMLFAVIYLLYKNLFAVIIVHFLNDFLIIANTGTANQEAQSLVATVVTTLIYMLVIWFVSKMIINKKLNC
ncbi:CPBP family intramembrane metalloprotease [Lactobacillus salivarius]|uniref:CPBP family intramembrane metalloprotease n=1 Tax=Ligilactobacillus salivarius TaxID=1624 RepID=A0A6A8LRI6_9LACO|nr:CPBP family intramembrane metalloprotease [Ligilactobacillus salivarius]MSE08313.1 CPBP family intramembrane metalloprotease [Ligilactobacillus salivarius]